MMIASVLDFMAVPHCWMKYYTLREVRIKEGIETRKSRRPV